MELNTKCIFVANTCKMLTSLLTSVKGAIEKDCNKSASSRSIKLITFLNSAVSCKSSSRNYGILRNSNNKKPPSIYLLPVKCLLLIPFHSSSIKLLRRPFKNQKTFHHASLAWLHFIPMRHVTGLDFSAAARHLVFSANKLTVFIIIQASRVSVFSV